MRTFSGSEVNGCGSVGSAAGDGTVGRANQPVGDVQTARLSGRVQRSHSVSGCEQRVRPRVLNQPLDAGQVTLLRRKIHCTSRERHTERKIQSLFPRTKRKSPSPGVSPLLFLTSGFPPPLRTRVLRQSRWPDAAAKWTADAPSESG